MLPTSLGMQAEQRKRNLPDAPRAGNCAARRVQSILSRRRRSRRWRLQRSEQYTTSSQLRFHLARQLKGRSQTGQFFCGSCDFFIQTPLVSRGQSAASVI